METNPPGVSLEHEEVLTASEYRRRYGRTLMVLKKLRAELPESDELCRIAAVDTAAPGIYGSDGPVPQWHDAKFPSRTD